MNRKRLYSIVAIVLIVSGLLIAAVPLATDEYANYYQSRMLSRFDDFIKNNGKQLNEDAENTDDVLFVIEIPEIGLRAAVIKGTSFSDLMKGPGWYTESSLPGKGNTAIAGHRTMFGAWFNRLHELKAGDEIILYYRGKQFIYQVEKIFKVNPSDTDVLNDTEYPALTLTTCEPIGRATERLIVRARLIETR